MNCTGGCTVEIPGPGLAVVLLNPGNTSDSDGFWVGNSTIAGLYGYSSADPDTSGALRLDGKGMGGVLMAVVVGVVLGGWQWMEMLL